MRALMWMKILTLVFGLGILAVGGIHSAIAENDPPVVNTEQLMCAEKAAALQSLEQAKFHTVFLGEVQGSPVVGMIKPPSGDDDGMFIILGLKDHESKIVVCRLLNLKVFRTQ